MTMTSTVTQESKLADDDTRMEEIDNTPVELDSELVEEHNKYVLRFQFYASKQKTAPEDKGHIATMTSKIVNKILSIDQKTKVLDSKGNNVDRQGIINMTDADVHNKFRFVTKPNARRQHELWVQVATELEFKALKSNLMEFIVQEKIWLIHHIFVFKIL